MKKKKFWLGILAITLVLTIVAIGCGGEDPTDGNNNNPQTAIYQGIATGYNYVLTITENKLRAAYTAEAGDSYELRITKAGEADKVSKGTVTANNNGTLTLQPETANSQPFNVSTTTDGKINAISNMITLVDGTTVTAGNFEDNSGSGGETQTFTSISEMATWLRRQNSNTKDTPFNIKLNVSDLGGIYSVDGSAGKALKDNNTKYVNLDLSSSTFTAFPSSGTYEGAFSNCTSITGVTIPDNVTSIGGEATFYGCTNLTRVTIGKATTIIYAKDFSSCTNITVITVDAENTSLSTQDGVLYNKNKTTLIYYPPKKTGSTFTIPESVTYIENMAFINCSILADLSIPSSVNVIFQSSTGEQVFQSCPGITAINVDAANTKYSSQDGVLYNKAKTSLLRYPPKKTGSAFTIPESVTSIWSYAFSECTSLASVTFQSTIALTSPNSGGFYGDLRTKYLATNGGKGTYTTTAPVSSSSVWTKQN